MCSKLEPTISMTRHPCNEHCEEAQAVHQIIIANETTLVADEIDRMAQCTESFVLKTSPTRQIEAKIWLRIPLFTMRITLNEE